MKDSLKEIYIGKIIETKVNELKISSERISKFLSIEESEIEKMYNSKAIDSGVLLRWSKLLEYDFFRCYSQHLIFYTKPTHKMLNNVTILPVFRKNIYTKEFIDFITDLVNTKQKTKAEIIAEYKIPKATLYKWISKYNR